MHALSTVGAGFYGGLFDCAQRLGVDRAALLQRAGLGADAASDASARLPVTEVVALFEAAQHLSQRSELHAASEFGAALTVLDREISATASRSGVRLRPRAA